MTNASRPIAPCSQRSCPAGSVDLVGSLAPPPAAPSSSRPRTAGPTRGGRGAIGEPWRRSIRTSAGCAALGPRRRRTLHSGETIAKRASLRSAGVDVVLVRWPADETGVTSCGALATRGSCSSRTVPRPPVAPRRPGGLDPRPGRRGRPAGAGRGPAPAGGGHASTRRPASTTTGCCAWATLGVAPAGRGAPDRGAARPLRRRRVTRGRAGRVPGGRPARRAGTPSTSTCSGSAGGSLRSRWRSGPCARAATCSSGLLSGLTGTYATASAGRRATGGEVKRMTSRHVLAVGPRCRGHGLRR